jgi:hypothetical protein
MLFEHLNASGVGLSIGSIGASGHHSCINNITFRHSIMPNSFKGLYLKARPSDPHGTGQVSNILYENITINNPTQWAIWLGPQQAVYKGACSLAWPWTPGAECPMTDRITWSNITFKDITVNSPALSPGVIIGNSSNPMQNVVFDNVVVNKPGYFPFFSDYYKCRDVEGIATGRTSPVPPCFKKQD